MNKPSDWNICCNIYRWNVTLNWLVVSLFTGPNAWEAAKKSTTTSICWSFNLPPSRVKITTLTNRKNSSNNVIHLNTTVGKSKHLEKGEKYYTFSRRVIWAKIHLISPTRCLFIFLFPPLPQTIGSILVILCVTCISFSCKRHFVFQTRFSHPASLDV